MSSSFGTLVKVSVFGQSHSAAIGAMVGRAARGQNRSTWSWCARSMRRPRRENAMHSTNKRRERTSRR
jgi:chorismate synthase